MDMDEKKVMSFAEEVGICDKVREVAKKEGLSMSDIIRRAVRKEVKNAKEVK